MSSLIYSTHPISVLIDHLVKNAAEHKLTASPSTNTFDADERVHTGKTCWR